MAGDWIKMRTNLRTHPKVARLASALNADRLRVVGGLHAVWCLFDEHSVDGRLDGYTIETLDDELRWPGFSAAMIGVQWLEKRDDAICTPRFDEHNGQSAKRRCQEAERKRNERNDRKLSASDADKKRTREEKRREEKSNDSSSAHSTSRASAAAPPPGHPAMESLPAEQESSAPAADHDYATPRAAPLPMREQPPVSADPAVQLSVALRRLGVNATFTHPHVQEWGRTGVSHDILVEAVRIARERKKGTIPPGYLRPIVDELLNQPAPKPQTNGSGLPPALGKAGQQTAHAAEQWLREQGHA